MDWKWPAEDNKENPVEIGPKLPNYQNTQNWQPWLCMLVFKVVVEIKNKLRLIGICPQNIP